MSISQQLEDLGSPINAFLRECCEVRRGFEVPTTARLIVVTENLDTDRVAIGESKRELERPVQRDCFA